ncbi:spfh domain-containing protein [Moumouvirus maliensis]|nr:spfh domain-containing protein [Moumouvirus maliensis]
MNREGYEKILGEDNYDEPVFASILRSFGCIIGYSCIPFYCIGCCYPYKSVDKGSKGVIQEFGRFKRETGDGLHYVNPLTERISVVDTRTKLIDLQRQNVMTSDKLSISIDSVVYYRVTDVQSALFEIEDVIHSIIELSHATLRNVVGTYTLSQCLNEREKLAESIKIIVVDHTKNWGVEIISLQIKDIVVPKDIIHALSSTVTAEREAEAKIIIAKGNVKSAELMRQAADMLNTQAAMQIRSLEVIDKLAASSNTKIVLLPNDLNLRSNIVTNEIISK